MALCFVDPADAIRAIADSVGREARRQLLGEAVRAWVDEIPDEELQEHYAKALSETFLPRYDGEVLYAGDGGTPLVGAQGQDWDAVLLVRPVTSLDLAGSQPVAQVR